MDFVRLGVLCDTSDPLNCVILEGYHVDSLSEIEGASAYIVEPNTVRHQFQGVDSCFKYNFPDKETADSFLAQYEVNSIVP